MSDATTPPAAAGPKLELRNVSVRYGGAPVVRGVHLSVARNSIHAFIGPAGSGKTSLLRAITLLAQDVDGAKADGEILLDGADVLRGRMERAELRRRVGMVFASPVPLPGSIRYNLCYGPRLAGRPASGMDELVESSLRAAQLWDEVKDRLGSPATALSGGQQQRLCIARTIALGCEVILLDEPCSGLDPISTLKIEEAMESLRERFTWIIVTNNTKQAARVSDRTAFFLLGELVEDAPTDWLFTTPQDPRTADYIEGRFG
jgi:phosphate transport system ATP-binding protein